MKIIKTVLLSLSLFFSTAILAQNKVLDSLKQELLQHPEKDTTRVRMLNNLIYDLQEIDLETAEMYIKESEFIIDSLNFTAGKAQLLYYKGYIDLMKSNYLKVIEQNKEAIELYETLHKKRGVSYSHNSIGNAYYYLGDFPKAIESYERSIEIDLERGDERAVAYNVENIGNIYADQGNYDKAILNYNKSKVYKERENDSTGLVILYLNIGSIYAEKNDSPRAIENYNKALGIHSKIKSKMELSVILIYSNLASVYIAQENYDKAIEYYKKALIVSKRISHKRGIASCLEGMGTINKMQSKNKEALAFFQEALELYKSINNQKGVADSLTYIGDIQFNFENYAKALDYYRQALKINEELELPKGTGLANFGIAKVYAQRKQYNEALKVALKVDQIGVSHQFIDSQRDAQYLLSKIYENLGDYKNAFLSHQDYKLLNDSIFNKENIEKITQLEFEYKYKNELESAERRELILTNEVKITSQDLEKSQRYLLQGVIAFLLLALVLAAIIFFLKLRNEKTKTQNIIIEQKLLRSQMTPHFIFNSLSVLQGMILNKEEKKSVSYLSKFSKLLRTTLENSRHKVVALSEELSAIDSYMALQNLDVNPPFNYKPTIDFGIDDANLKIPPMLIQPFIENAIEHAFPNKKDNKEIHVTLAFKEEKLVCMITDNGIGIHLGLQKNKKNKNSLATTITSERLKMLSKDFKTKGSITIEDRQISKENGTKVTLVIPYKLEEA